MTEITRTYTAQETKRNETKQDRAETAYQCPLLAATSDICTHTQSSTPNLETGRMLKLPLAA